MCALRVPFPQFEFRMRVNVENNRIVASPVVENGGGGGERKRASKQKEIRKKMVRQRLTQWRLFVALLLIPLLRADGRHATTALTAQLLAR